MDTIGPVILFRNVKVSSLRPRHWTILIENILQLVRKKWIFFCFTGHYANMILIHTVIFLTPSSFIDANQNWIRTAWCPWSLLLKGCDCCCICIYRYYKNCRPTTGFFLAPTESGSGALCAQICTRFSGRCFWKFFSGIFFL